MQYLSLQQGADKVLRLTQRMLESATQENWQDVITMEQERARSIESLFRHPELQQQLITIAATLQQVITLDKRCMSLGMHYRLQLARKLDGTLPIQQGVRAYQQFSE